MDKVNYHEQPCGQLAHNRHPNAKSAAKIIEV